MQAAAGAGEAEDEEDERKNERKKELLTPSSSSHSWQGLAVFSVQSALACHQMHESQTRKQYKSTIFSFSIFKLVSLPPASEKCDCD